MNPLEGLPIVTAEEMARLEKDSLAQGDNAEDYMLTAGEHIATHVMQFVQTYGLKKQVTLLTGKGNNGGDAYVAGVYLLKNGYDVKAFYVHSDKEPSNLNAKYKNEFLRHQGQALLFKHAKDFEPYTEAPILDGLLGTGFQGQVEGALKELIKSANDSGFPILSIDIPSGLNGNTGEVGGISITACRTYYLGLPKAGFFLREGYEKIGKLVRIDFGLNLRTFPQMSFHLFNEDISRALLPKIKRTRHKYERGYVIALAGSKGMPGAALLSCLSVLRAGAGIVRLFHPEGMEKELSGSFKELIKNTWSLKDTTIFYEEMKRARSFLIGPGLGRSEDVQAFLLQIFNRINIPCVIDADALEIFAQQNVPASFPCILTPHKKEMMRCLQLKGEIKEEVFLELCQSFADRLKVTVVLKGAPTRVFHPNHPCLVIPRGDPGMATAGSGDVLTGIIAALLAQGLAAREAAALGVYLHALAGEYAAKKTTSYAMIASDIVDALPEVFLDLSAE